MRQKGDNNMLNRITSAFSGKRSAAHMEAGTGVLITVVIAVVSLVIFTALWQDVIGPRLTSFVRNFFTKADTTLSSVDGAYTTPAES